MRRNQGGFTLIEMLAVFTIMALAAMFVLPALSEMAWNMQLQGSLTRIDELMQRARGEAIRLNRPFAVTFSPSGQCIAAGSGPGDALVLNRDVLFLDEEAPDVEVTFNGDATSGGGRVRLCDSKGGVYLLTVEASNGRCRIERGSEP